MQALSGITSRLDKVQSFLDDKKADTPLAVNEDDAAARRKEEEAAIAAQRRRAAAASADAVKDELLGAVQDDDDDDALEPAALKADIEGYEWDVFDALARSGAESLLPLSLSIEVHLWTEVKEVRWRGRWRRPEETAGWMETLRTVGYALVDRHDNPLCSYCSEITLARIAPPRNAAGAPARIKYPPPCPPSCAMISKRKSESPNRHWRLCGFPTLLLSAHPHASSTDAPLEALCSPSLGFPGFDCRVGRGRRGPPRQPPKHRNQQGPQLGRLDSTLFVVLVRRLRLQNRFYECKG